MTPTTIILILIAAVVLWAIVAYNRFIRLIQRTKEAWADIDVQLVNRHETIPALIDVVKGYASHERETFDAVTNARAEATKVHVDPSKITPEAIAAMAGAEQTLTQSLGKLLAVAEAYPDLKANTNFLQLQKDIYDIQEKIKAARRFYNGNVRDLKIALQSFPSNVIGGIFKFKEEAYFEIEEDAKEREMPKTDF